MGYRSLRDCVDDLERHGQLVRIDEEVDPDLEAAEIHRRVYASGGPAIYFNHVRGTPFPMVSNLFGTLERARFLFRDALAAIERLFELKVDPSRAMRSPWRYLGVPWTALHMLPRRVRGGHVFAAQTSISELPQLRSWPDDGGAFITLPQVYSEHPERKGLMASNLGMYRVQLSGGRYEPDREVGLHYQIHRGIGVHHQAALARGEALRVAVFVGGPPAMTLAAVMPLPEGLSELMFAGALGRRRVRMAQAPGLDDAPPVHADADFCIVGRVEPNRTLPEGPFGDHLGYYSLVHDFPVLRVDAVFHRRDAIWPFTVVGRPPQEDTTFGQLIHELTGPVIPSVVPGVHAVHAVDAAGVHPLMLALGSERYWPFDECRRPMELLTQASAILGQGQMSLAKYLIIADRGDDAALDVEDIETFFAHVLARFDPRRDLHFHTETTIDTLDYSGSALNVGSKLVIAAVGPAVRELPSEVPTAPMLPAGFDDARVAMRGVLVLRGPAHAEATRTSDIERLCKAIGPAHPLRPFPLIVLCDDSALCAASLRDFAWVTFTRSDPARDLHGVDAFVRDKHWGCAGPLVIDARRKRHHAPPLIEDAKVSARVDRFFARGSPLAGLSG